MMNSYILSNKTVKELLENLPVIKPVPAEPKRKSTTIGG
jgi:hypothetical protein